MSTNPNGKGSEDNSYTVVGSIPTVLTLPSEAAQHLANHLYSKFTPVDIDRYGEICGQWDNQDMARVIQEYWDSLI